MKRSAITLVVIGIAGLGWTFVAGQTELPGPKRSDKHAALMRAKLASSQKVVEGLVSKDFITIEEGAEELLKICRADEWKSREDEIYSHHRRELMKQAQKISIAAKSDSLDGAAYSYIHALTTCISCHDYCRDVLKIAENSRDQNVIQIPTAIDQLGEPSPLRTVRR